MKITYYLEVTSSWCYWAEPAWAELKQRYAGRVEFHWKIASMPPEAYPASKAQCEWFYRRSGTIMRSPFMLDSCWFEADMKQYVAPNCVAEAAKELGVTDDRVRLALAQAALREGKKIGRWEVSAEVAAKVAGLNREFLLQRAQSPEIKARVDATTAEFHALQVNQRPTFLLENNIGDRAVFSGLAKVEPLAAAIDAMLSDAAAYQSYAAHFGALPKA
ncbi:DsbA family oxidoreductase [Pedosphaera parvula]|uniref:DSBA oxidoreductase n=1 Tax=Pedosphaera parvula (strain Ellin514) TaxID=320771 RepID=B9XCK0_PEDPL|nr:DsbA family protein [Pedosphaera parvula]EEF62668.1 DSBA oxidoreductase [Pedosphaera parvula Ellin514]